MTAEQKKSRRDRIERVADHRKRRSMTCWISRNSDAGDVPVPTVNVWLVHPERVKCDDGSVYWRVPGGNAEAKVDSAEGPVRAHFGIDWTLEACLKEFRVYPDDSLQLIRAGEEDSPDILP